jgi:hypothetical protein
MVLNSSVAQIEGFRREWACRKRAEECFNAFNLARLRICRLPLAAFDTLDRILLREMNESGRLDYALLPFEELNSKYQ